MIDVTDIDCKEGDSVEIFGDHLPITVISDVLETITYEAVSYTHLDVYKRQALWHVRPRCLWDRG